MSKAITLARTVLIEAFENDPDFKQVYIDNIACCLMDEQNHGPASSRLLNMNSPEDRNNCAKKIMDHLFNPKDLEDE